MKNILTHQVLAKEFIDWQKQNGVGRNCAGMRFGQHICNKYELKNREAFYTEDANIAYDFFCQSLT